MRVAEKEFFENVRRSIKISYFVASIIPLSVLIYLSLKYINPYLNETGGEFFSSTGIILLLSVVLSLLGFTLIIKTTNKTLASIQDSYAKLNSLFEVTKHFRDTHYVDVLLESIVQSATRLIDADAGSLMLADDKGDLWFKVAVGKESIKLKDKSVKPGESVSGWVFETGNSAIINNVENDKRFNPQIDLETGYKTKSILCVPLVYSQQPIGVLEILNKRSGDFSESDEKLLFILADQASISIAQSKSRESAHSDMIQMTEILVNAMDHHIPVQRGHTKRVAMHANAIGKELDLNDDELKNLHFAAVLHDIGLLRFEYFEQMEEEKLKQHPTMGFEMVRPISSWKDIAQIILFHHERYDGTGYPMGKKGEEIPLYSRIISVADTFDILTSESSYKEKIPQENAIEELERNAGTQFDPAIVSAFKKSWTS